MEDPKTTLMKLIKENIGLTKDDYTAATVHVSHDWYNSALFKIFDAQISVGLLRGSSVKPLNLARSHIRYLDNYRIIGWSIDKPGTTGKTMRWKLRKEIERIIRENFKTPGGALSFVDVRSVSESEDVNAKPPYWRVQVTVVTHRYVKT